MNLCLLMVVDGKGEIAECAVSAGPCEEAAVQRDDLEEHCNNEKFTSLLSRSE